MVQIIQELAQELNWPVPHNLSVGKCEIGYEVVRKGDSITINCSNKVQLAKALVELKRHGNQDFSAKGACRLDNMGIMFDCSRNGVLKVETVKKLIRLSAMMGYNMVLLYLEDTYTIEERPYFGYLRGRYSHEELRQIDAYAEQFDIQIVPCIQTLAHMNAAKKWWDLGDMFDIDDILLCDNEKTYAFIDNMFAAMRKCFKTDLINIGMDEAFMLGLGRYLKANGYQDRFTIMLKHLDRVYEIAKKYGYKPMMWSDMFFRIVNDGEYYGKNPVPNEVIEKVPEDVALAYWDYRALDTEQYDRMLGEHNRFNRDVWMVNTAWKCIGMVPHNYHTFRTVDALMPAMEKHGIKNFFTTCWGDNGADCSVYSVLPSLCYIALRNYGVSDREEFADVFYALTDMKLEDYLLIDTPNMMGTTKLRIECPTKYFLYNDLFSGFLDARCYDDYASSLKERTKALAAYDGGKYPQIFRTAEALCAVLERKVDLGIRTRKAYQSGDRETMAELAENVYPELIRRIEAFHEAFYIQWHTENKGQGFEIMDIRLGGLIQRVKTCRMKLINHLKTGVVIEELEDQILPFKWKDADDEHLTYYNWSNFVTVNTI